MLASPVELQDLPAEEAAELDYDMKEIFAMQHVCPVSEFYESQKPI